MTNNSDARKATEELVTYLSEYFNQIKADPYVAIPAIEILKHRLIFEDIFTLTARAGEYFIDVGEPATNDEDIDNMFSNLVTFIEELKEKIRHEKYTPLRHYIIPPAVYFVTALEIVKQQLLMKST